MRDSFHNFFRASGDKTCAFMRYSAHGGRNASRSERASCRRTARTDPGATRAVNSAEDKLPQLLSREREIEHLKLLLVKLHRMQFGRKSEKLQRQIEQLELRLEELESNRSEKETQPPEPASDPTSATPAPAKPTRRTLPDHLPRANPPAQAQGNSLSAMPGRTAQVRRGRGGDAGVRARQFPW